MSRPANPMDLALLWTLQARAFPNAARSRRVLASGAGRVLPYGALLREMFLRTRRRRAWLLARRGLPLGVVVVSQRQGPTCWEVECLQAARGHEQTVRELLDGTCHAAGQAGACKVFLRMPADSPLTALARQAQFTPYVCEQLFERPSGPPTPLVMRNGRGSLRPSEEGDEHHLHRLYQAVVPAPAREAEGLNFVQWRESLDLPRGWRWRESYVLDCGGAVAGWLALGSNGNKGVIDMLARPDGAAEAELMVAAGVQAVGDYQTLLCFVPSYQSFLEGPLYSQGFRKTGELVLHVRHVAAQVKQRQMVAVGALPQ